MSQQIEDIDTASLPSYVHGEIVEITPTLINEEWAWVVTTAGTYLLTWAELGMDSGIASASEREE